MTDPRNHLRPMLHSGVPHKVTAAVQTLIEHDDDALYDWVLQATRVGDAAMSEPWLWKYDDVQELRHPSLNPEPALTILSHARTPLAMEIREALKKLCIELGFNRREEPVFDVSMLAGLTEVEKLRIMPRDPPSLYKWRDELMGGAKPLVGFDSIAGMSSLKHLTIIGGAGVDLAALSAVGSLRYVELIACDLTNTDHLSALSATDVIISHCHGLESIDGLPANAKTVRLEMLPDLTKVANISGKKLISVELLGAPKLKTKPSAAKIKFTFSTEAPQRDSF